MGVPINPHPELKGRGLLPANEWVAISAPTEGGRVPSHGSIEDDPRERLTMKFSGQATDEPLRNHNARAAWSAATPC